MNPAGLVIVALGALVIAQVTAGHALDRLGLTSSSTSGTSSTEATAATYTAPTDPGLTSTKPSKPKTPAPSGWTFGDGSAEA